jgi:beta-ribofuranosylaminobenzene 5'-phosphate synthase
MPVEVSASSRVHFGLVDTSGQTPRMFGGIGAVLDQPRVVVRAKPADEVSFRGLSDEADPLASTVIERVEAFLRSARKSGVDLEVVTELPRHVGLGSGTATIMASLRAAAVVTDAVFDDATLRTYSRRGGASGTGVNGFAVGGWIVDAGQPKGTPALPTRSAQVKSPSLMTLRVDPPPWAIDLYLPHGESIDAAMEKGFFEREAGAVGTESLEALALLHHGLIPALVEQDLASFGESMKAFQGVGFKRREIAAQSESVQEAIDQLHAVYPCVGMSSFGPVVVALRHLADPVPWSPQACHFLASTSVAEEGARTIWID